MGKLRVPHAENPLDKQIAATALMYNLAVVTRNAAHYEPTGVAVLNPFT
jgi:toxin FitB